MYDLLGRKAKQKQQNEQRPTPELVAYNNLFAFYCYLHPDWEMGVFPMDLSHRLQNAIANRRNTVFTGAPRVGKSELLTVTGNAWFMGRNPTKKTMHLSYSEESANDFGGKVRDIIQSEAFQSIFPGVTIKKSQKKKTFFKFDNGGECHFVYPNGPSNGKGFHVGFVDDVVKDRQAANSAAKQKEILDFWSSAFLTRAETGALRIFCQTRWNHDDIIAKLLKIRSANWDYFAYPALCIDPENDLLGRKLNESVVPHLYSTQDFLNIKEEQEALGRGADFSALYLCNPVPDSGGIFYRQWFPYHNYHDLPKFKKVITSWDLGFRKNKHGSFTVGQLWGLSYDNRVFLLDEYRDTVNFTVQLEEVKKMRQHAINRYGQHDVGLIEAKANGDAMISFLRDSLNLDEFVGVEPGRSSKVDRAVVIQPAARSGNIVIPNPMTNGNFWVEGWLNEFTGLGIVKNDDRVDTTSQAVTHLLNINGNANAEDMWAWARRGIR